MPQIFLKRNQERIGQWSSKTRAQKYAAKLERETGRKHQVMLSHTWRDLQWLACWTVYMK